MQPKDWESLFLVALSHGEQLRTRQLTHYWFNKFVELSIGLNSTVSHKTGVTPLFLQLIWQRRGQLQPTADRSAQQRGSKPQAAMAGPAPPETRAKDVHHEAAGVPVDDSEGYSSQLSSNSCSLVPGGEGNSTVASDHEETVAPPGEADVCNFEQFVQMMQQVTIRCYQSARASELLHRFNERVAISSTAVQSVSPKEALHYATRYYFVRAFERSFVSRDSVVSLDPERSTMSPIAHIVIAHAMAQTMDSMVLPLFRRFSNGCGLMRMEQFLAFVHFLFDGHPTPKANFVRAIFCQVNVHNTLSKVELPTVAGQPPPSSPSAPPREPEIELDEFVDALCLLGVLMFSNEVVHPTLRTIESKVWALLTHISGLQGVAMCTSPTSDDTVSQLEPRLSLVCPSALPVYAYTGFVVGGICLDVEDARGEPSVGTNDDDAMFTTSSSLMAPKRHSDDMAMPIPMDGNGDFLAHATMLQSRTKQNAVAAQAAKLLTSHFEDLFRAPLAVRAPHKPMTARDGAAAGDRPIKENLRERPIESGNPLEGNSDDNSRCSSSTPGSRQSPLTGVTSTPCNSIQAVAQSGRGRRLSESTGSQSNRSQTSPPSKEIALSLQDTSGIYDHNVTAAHAIKRKRRLTFFVDGCAVQQHQQIAPGRHKLALPKACLADVGSYTAYCAFRIETSVNDDDEEVRRIVSVLHRERLVDVSVGEAIETATPSNGSATTSVVQHNAVPIILRLKPLERRFKEAVQERLEQLFERHAPTGRMDLQQFSQAVHCMKNMVKTPERTAEAFDKFASDTNGDMTLSLGKAPSGGGCALSVAFDGGMVLAGGPRLSFEGFLHAAAYLYIDTGRGVSEQTSTINCKTPNVEGFFELAFEEDVAAGGLGDNGIVPAARMAAAQQSTTPQSQELRGGAAQLNTRRSMQQLRMAAVESNVPQSIDAANVWDYRLQASYDRALHWRELSRNTNVALEMQWHEQFWQAMEDVPPEPNFTAPNPAQTLLSAAITNHDNYNQALPSMAAMGLMSFDARSQSMQLEYFTGAMVRTLSSR